MAASEVSLNVVSKIPFGLSLSKACPELVEAASAGRSWFDKLTTNGFGVRRLFAGSDAR